MFFSNQKFMKNRGISGIGIQDLLFIKDCGNNPVKSLRWDIEVFIQRESLTKNRFFFHLVILDSKFGIFWGKTRFFISENLFYKAFRGFTDFYTDIRIFNLWIFHMFSRGFRNFSTRFSRYFFIIKLQSLFALP